MNIGSELYIEYALFIPLVLNRLLQDMHVARCGSCAVLLFRKLLYIQKQFNLVGIIFYRNVVMLDVLEGLKTIEAKC